MATPGWCPKGGELLEIVVTKKLARPKTGAWRCPQCRRRLQLQARGGVCGDGRSWAVRVPAHKPRVMKAKTPGRKERRGRRV